MQEYVTEGIVLAKEPIGELDIRVSIFTKDLGKLVARARSGRKILSKLSPHLEPGNVIQARFVEKKGLHVVDALKSSRLNISPYDLETLNRTLGEGEIDDVLWNTLHETPFSWSTILPILGWDPQYAMCEMCALRKPHTFHADTQRFFCESCAFLLPKTELVFI